MPLGVINSCHEFHYLLQASFLFCLFCLLPAQQRIFQTFPDLEHRIGQHFPIEEYKDGTGKNFSPEALQGKNTLINFWSTNCMPCIKELPYLNQLQEKAGKQANFIAITYEPGEKVSGFLKNHPFSFQQVTDAEKQLKTYFPILRNPVNFIIDKNGNIKEITGVIDESKMGIIAAILNQ